MAVIVPSIPQNPIIQQGNGQVLFSWDIVAGSTGYPVYRSTDNVNFTLVSTPTVNEYLDTTVTPNTQYWYKVGASNSQGTSPLTNSLDIIPTESGVLSLGQLREMAKQRADRQNSEFVTTPEWNTYINQSYFELYDILVTAFEDYYVAEPLVVQTTGVDTVELPNGINHSGARPFYKLLGIDLSQGLNTNAWITVHKFNFISRNRFVFPNITSTALGVFNLRYRVFGDKIKFIPTPSGNQLLRIWYIPRLQQLLKDTDTLDGVSGWTEYVVIDAAIKALQKEESDVSLLMAQKQMIIDRIQAAAMNRDAGLPDTISDSRSFSERWGGYGSPNGDGNFSGY